MFTYRICNTSVATTDTDALNCNGVKGGVGLGKVEAGERLFVAAVQREC